MPRPTPRKTWTTPIPKAKRRIFRKSPILPKRRGRSPSRSPRSVSYTHLRAHETRHDLVCRLLLEKKKAKELCDAEGQKFFFQRYGDHRAVHRVERRQRQMCIRDRSCRRGGDEAPAAPRG